jgi:hypothetical protein
MVFRPGLGLNPGFWESFQNRDATFFQRLAVALGKVRRNQGLCPGTEIAILTTLDGSRSLRTRCSFEAASSEEVGGGGRVAATL